MAKTQAFLNVWLRLLTGLKGPSAEPCKDFRSWKQKLNFYNTFLITDDKYKNPLDLERKTE